MRILTIAIAVLGALSFSSCDNPVADTDIHDLAQVRKRSEDEEADAGDSPE